MNSANSRWWFFVPIYPISLLFLVLQIGDAGGSTIWVRSLGPLVAIAGFVVLIGNTPLAICLFMDARAVKSGDFDWKPNQYAYGILGFSGNLTTSYIGFSSTNVTILGFNLDWALQFRQFAVLIPFITCIFYLFQRYRYVGFR